MRQHATTPNKDNVRDLQYLPFITHARPPQ